MALRFIFINLFSYSGNGRLDEIKNYQRSLQVAGLHLANTYQFIYSGNRLDTIRRKDSSAALTGYTAFMYGDGQITNIANQSYDQFTGAAFGYSQSGGYQVISGDYLFHNGGSMTYVMKYQNGNKTSDQAVSSTGGSESGEYEYDDYINPRHQLGYPDQYFTNSSKNNMLRENKQYNGSIPQAIPYHFGYEYDADGYPREAVISYKGYSSGQHLYRIRKIYRYQ